MKRTVASSTVGAGSNVTTSIVATADLMAESSVAVWFFMVSADGPCRLRFRSEDNDVDISGDILVADDDDAIDSVIFAQGQFPWFIGPQNDGLEINILGLQDAGTVNWSVHIGTEQRLNDIIAKRDDQPVVP